MNKQADSHLALEDEALVQKELVHLRPVSPIPLPGATLQWLTALVGVLALFFIKGMALLGLAPSGLAPVQILQGVLRQTAVGQPMEKVGTRLLFERHFRLITELLGKRRLVLFIDDLDRCDHEYTRQVLEVSNFLASSGDLFMVLGLAPRYVLANVTLSFQDLAKAVHEADMLNGNGQTSGHDAKAGQSWFARQYLQKLIHIEVPVPRPENAQVLAMLTLEGDLSAQEKALEKVEEREQQLDQMLATAGRFLQVGLLLAALGGGVYLGLNPGWYADNPAETKSVAATLAAPAAERDNPAPATQPPPEVKPNEPNKATGSAVFVEGYSAKNYQNWPLWLALALAATLMLGGMVLFRLVQRLDKLEDKPGLAWMQTLLKRLRIWLLGPESKKDTRDFMDALKFWHGLIAAKNPSPRTIKAFVNRLRYFASRDASEDGNGREAQLVALATIFYAFEENIQGDLNLSAFYDEILNSPADDQQDKRRLIFADAWREHVKAFGAPSAQDLQFYQALSEDIIIHRSD